MKGLVVVGMLASIATACGAGRTSSITVVTDQPPALIAYREEGAPDWRTPSGPSTGRYEFEVAGPYRVIVVCDDSRQVAVAQLARTVDDAPSIELPCGDPPVNSFLVRGRMLQPGTVSFDLTGVDNSTAPWSFDLFTTGGTFDLVAFSGDASTGFDHFEIRRDITITADQDLGTIDVAQVPAQALVPTRFTATNLAASESPLAYVVLQSGNTHAAAIPTTQPEHAWQLGLVPSAALRSTDTQDVYLAAGAPLSEQPMQRETRQFIRRVRDGGSTLVTLMDAIGPTRFESTADRLVATWTSLPEYDQLVVGRSSISSSRSVAQRVGLSHAFVASTGTGARSVALDFTDVPGFRPEWRHDPTLDQQFVVLTSRGTLPDDYTSSEVDESVRAPSPLGVGNAPRGIHAHQNQLQRLHQVFSERHWR